jgi:hypothetical protein
MQRLISSPSAFLFWGYERFLSIFSSAQLSALPCSNVSFVHLADRMTNDASHRRQSKLDNQKTYVLCSFVGLKWIRLSARDLGLDLTSVIWRVRTRRLCFCRCAV